MADHEGSNAETSQAVLGNSTAAQNPALMEAASSNNIPSSSSSGHNWTTDEIWLLLGYVEANCVFTTVKGINLKKSEFTKASDVVKTRTTAQCHTKWGRVSGFVIKQNFDYL